MANLAHIALFQPIESSASNIMSLFRREGELSVKQLKSFEELSQIYSGDGDIDLIIIPSVLLDRASAIHLCIKIKSDENLSHIPIILISLIKDTPTISTFYGAGADIVLAPPFDPELLYLQINALIRYRGSLTEERGRLNRDLGLRQAMVKTLHQVQEAILILDSSAQVVFANRSARELLRVFDAPDPQEERVVFKSIEEIVINHLSDSSINGNNSKHQNINLKRLKCAQNTTINAQLQISPLEVEELGLVAYCVTISDTELPSGLHETLLQAERIQSLSLLLMAGCGRLIGSPALGLPGTPLSKIEDNIFTEAIGCSISLVVTSLVEVLDLVLSSKSSVKVNLLHDYLIEIKTSDLMQLVGHMIFYAISQTAHDCDLEIKATPLSSKRAINLSVEATLPIRSTTMAQEKIRTIFRNDTLRTASDSQSSIKLSNGIILARQIASKYGSELKLESSTLGKVALSTVLVIR